MKIQHPYNEEIQELIIRVLQKTASPDEVKKVRTWLSLDPKNIDYYNEFRIIWQSVRSSSRHDYDPGEAWKRLSSKTAENSKPAVRSWFPVLFLRVAALIIIAFGSGMGLMYLVSRFSEPVVSTVFTEHIVPYGSKSHVILPDGSVIWLNAGTSLKYTQDFNLSNREVFLDGEAYFDVRKNTKLPFCVKTYGVNIKVTGTAFNVKAYRDEKVIETTVERGKVEIYGKGNIEFKEKKITVMPKQMAALSFTSAREQTSALAVNRSPEKTGHPTFQIEKNVATELYTSWKDKRWIIEKEELGSLAVKIARKYDVTVEFDCETIKHYVFTGTIEDETLDQVVRIISLTAPISYHLEKKHLVLRKNKAFIEVLRHH
jgi:transmembrane sensor